MTNVPNKIPVFRHSTTGDLFYKYQTGDLELYSCRVLHTAARYPNSCRVPEQLQSTLIVVEYPNSYRVP